jgi:hypothetical protein
MKIFTYIVIALAFFFIVINTLMLDFSNLFAGDSLVGLIGIVAALCSVAILLIFRISKSIENKYKN